MTTQPEHVGLFSSRNENAVAVESISKAYGFRRKKTEILKGINLTIEKGSIYGLLGPSGCGKTTLLRLIVGRISPDSGTIKIFGHPVGSKESGIPGPGVGYMPQEIALYNEFSIKETLTYFGRLFGMSAEDIIQRSTFLMDLLRLSNQSAYVKNLSGGQKRRVSFAVSLFQNAPVLVLDEPTVGVDPLLRLSIWDYLVTLVKENKVAVLLTTHYIDEVRQANTAGLMRNGTILAEDTPENLLSRYHSPNLEDVFVKLCYADDQSSATMPDDNQNKDPDSSFEMTNIKPAQRNQSHRTSLDGQNHVTIKQPKKFASDSTICRGRIKALVGKNFISLIRNIGSLIFQFIVPSIILTVFCLSLGTKPRDLEVGFVNNDDSDLLFGDRFIELIDNQTITLIPYHDIDVGIGDVKKNKIWAFIYIPGNFSSNILKRFLFTMSVTDEVLEQGKIRAWIDPIDQQIMFTIQFGLFETAHKFIVSVLGQIGINPKAADLPITFENEIAGEDHSIESYMIFIAPAMIVLVCFFMSVALTNMSFVLEKKDGLMDRIYVAGATDLEIVFGFFISQGFVMIVQVTLALTFMILLFHVPCRGSLVWVALLLLLLGVCGMFQGLLVSSILDDEYLALFLQLTIFFPNFILSGVIGPLQGLPEALSYISYLLPLTVPIQSLRSLMLRGWDMSEFVVWMGFVVPLIWLAIFLIATILVLKWRK